MLRKSLIVSIILSLFYLGAYTEASFHITPVITAAFQTVKIMAADLYSIAVAPHLREMNPGFVTVATCLSVLLLLKKLFWAG